MRCLEGSGPLEIRTRYLEAIREDESRHGNKDWMLHDGFAKFLMFACNDLKGAEEHLKVVIDETGPNYLLGQADMGLCLYRQQKHREAIPFLSRAIEIQPNFKNLHHLLNTSQGIVCCEDAILNFQKGRYQKARVLLKKAEKILSIVVATDPGFPYEHYLGKQSEAQKIRDFRESP
jgi:tetratricopeptide (TPR) repeat protein